MELWLPLARSLNGLTSNANAARFPIRLCRQLTVVIADESGNLLATSPVTIQTKNLILAPHLPRHLRALLRGSQEFENIAGLRVADGIRDQFLNASSDFINRVENAREADPWRFGFGVIHKIDNVLIGIGGFPGPPDSNGVAEIAYGIAPAYQGKGYATEVANALIEFASQHKSVRLVRAHTLAETNASTRVLEKCGFQKVGETIDPENNLPIWRWDKPIK
jgi:RimJ/RimL family protein N-acetyltransferase